MRIADRYGRGNASVTPVTKPVTRSGAAVTDAVTRREGATFDEIDALWSAIGELRSAVAELTEQALGQASPVTGDRPKPARMTPAEKQAAYRARKRSATHGKEADKAGDEAD